MLFDKHFVEHLLTSWSVQDLQIARRAVYRHLFRKEVFHSWYVVLSERTEKIATQKSAFTGI